MEIAVRISLAKGSGTRGQLTGHGWRGIDDGRRDDVERVLWIELWWDLSGIKETTDRGEVDVSREVRDPEASLDCHFLELEDEPVSFGLVRLSRPCQCVEVEVSSGLKKSRMVGQMTGGLSCRQAPHD